MIYKTIEEYLESEDYEVKLKPYKRRIKRKRDVKYKKHLKVLSKTHALVFPVKDEEHIIENIEEADYCKRLYHSNKKSKLLKFYKQYSNKKIRRYNDAIKDGGSFKKIQIVIY